MVTGWKTATVKETSTIFGRIGFRGYTKEDIVDAYEGAISLSPSNLKDGKVDITNSTFISWDKYNESPEIKLQDGDVVLVKTGSTYGKSAYVDNLKWATTLNPQIVVFKNVKINKKLFAYFVQTPEFQKQIEATIVGGAIPTLSQNQVYQFEITFPIDVGEQKRIAEALSDVDGMISSLEKLIAKKKAVKQGAMQELLTGKKRLPGFTGEWHHEPFGKLCTICRGGSPRPIQDYLTTSDSGINWIKIGDVKPNAKYITSTQEKIVESGVSMSRRVYKGDFILSNSMSFGRPYILKLDGCIHDGWLAIQDYQVAFDTDFLYYVLGSNYVFEQYIQMAAGSSVQNLNKEKVAQLKLYIPALEEQTAIASILSDMDNEIEALEQKLEKTHQIKQGMMQQLLTGKIRLV